MAKAIEIIGLKKKYGKDAWALNGVDLAIEQGDFFGLLGLNGAGKTTLISILVGLVRLTEGQVKIMGHDVSKEPTKAKRQIGIVPQEININIFHTVAQVMFLHGGFHGMSRREIQASYQEILQDVGLLHKENVAVHKLSGGMKRRLLLARAVLVKPKILILDEPTAGVDVELRQDIWNLLKKKNAEGVSILLTSHYMEEVEHLCQNLAVLHQGRIVDSGHKRDILQTDQLRSFVFHFKSEVETLPDFEGVAADQQESSVFNITVEPSANLGMYLQQLEKLGYVVEHISSPTSRLEQYFRQQTK